MKPTLAWHFVKDDGSRAQDGVVEKVGKTYSATGPLALCKNGMHACEKVIDALEYAQGARLRRVECTGIGPSDGKKFCCRSRKVLWEIDATKVLHRFAIRVATDALKRAKVTDERCWNALKVKRLWLTGRATDGELAAAKDAVLDAAKDAVLDDAVLDVTWDAAWATARAAAWATWDAIRDAVLDVTRDKYNRWLEAMVEAEHKRVTKVKTR